MTEIAAKETEWVEKYLVPRIAKTLGKKSDNVTCNISFPENCFFVSCVYFIDLTFNEISNDREDSEKDTLKLVVKKPPLDCVPDFEEKMVRYFHNEILFYEKFGAGNPRFPRCFYTDDGDPKNSVIVMENISVQGYELCPKSHDVPLEYICSAVSEIGILHATAYVMKEQDPERFYNIVNDIQDPRFKDPSWMNDYVNALTTRPIDWLRRSVEKDVCDKLQRHLENAHEEIMLYGVKPAEPLATLCHGDFTRNNIFFRKIDGRLEPKLFDFALISYSSPAIDLSTFLYLNCSARDRVDNFEKIYRSYHDALTRHLRQHGITDLDKYSYEKMLIDYKRRAAFGYVIVSFFLVVDRGFVKFDLDGFFDDPMGTIEMVRVAGGDEITELFADMIVELKNLGTFDHVL